MKRLFLALFVLVALNPLSAFASANYPNEPAGSTPIYGPCPFSDDPCGMVSRYPAGFSYASPGGSGAVTPPRALDQYMLAGSTQGNGQWGIDFARKHEVFVGLTWRTNITGLPNNGNKIIFIKNPSNSLLNWYGLPGSGSKTLVWHQQEEVDNCHIPSYSGFSSGQCWNATNPAQKDGTGLFFPNVNGGAATLAPGMPFTKVELYLKGSTTNTSRDGILRIWVNGILTHNFTNVNHGTQQGLVSPGGFGNVEITAAWDGTVPPAPVDWHHYFDDMYVSIPNCPSGCTLTGGGGTPPVIPEEPPPVGDTFSLFSQFSGVQGQNGWTYLDTNGIPFTFNGTSQLWIGAQAFQGIWQNGFHPGTTNGTVMRWTVPSAGSANIAGTVVDFDTACGDGATVQIKHGATLLQTITLSGSDASSHAYSHTRSVSLGDNLDVVVLPGANNNCDSTALNPVVTFTASGGALPSPSVSGFLPTSGNAGDNIVITGSNFLTDPAANIVKFNGILAVVLAASTTSLTVTIPTGASTGTISVTTTTGTGTSGGTFTVNTTAKRQIRIPFSFSGLDVNGNREVVDHFNVYRATSIAGVYTKIGELDGSVRFYLDADAPVDRACYKFEAEDSSGNVGSMSTAKCAYSGVSPDADTTNPAAPFAVVPQYVQ